jgi:hydrogenase expression/formation protein HypD
MNTNAFSDPAVARDLVSAIHERAGRVASARIMEVCGTHTMEIGRLGIRQLLPANVELLSGPGCPVCVTPGSYLDTLASLALEKGVCVATFGDLFRVPGTTLSLAQAKAQGAAVEIVTSPVAALSLARKNPGRQVVFAAVGFETTIPATAAAVREAAAKRLDNLSFLVAHRLVPPALDALLADPELGINGFLLPGHVSAIIGEAAYAVVAERNIPGVITGFEPLDILAGILAALTMLAKKQGGVKNAYTRVVRPGGNAAARQLMSEIYEPCDAYWRGIGTLPASGLRLRPQYGRFDAAARFGTAAEGADMPGGCSCGDVLKGRIRPSACPLFGKTCDPDHPVGPCMVSSEGSCAAYFKYGG